MGLASARPNYARPKVHKQRASGLYSSINTYISIDRTSRFFLPYFDPRRNFKNLKPSLPHRRRRVSRGSQGEGSKYVCPPTSNAVCMCPDTPSSSALFFLTLIPLQLLHSTPSFSNWLTVSSSVRVVAKKESVPTTNICSDSGRQNFDPNDA